MCASRKGFRAPKKQNLNHWSQDEAHGNIREIHTRLKSMIRSQKTLDLHFTLEQPFTKEYLELHDKIEELMICFFFLRKWKTITLFFSVLRSDETNSIVSSCTLTSHYNKHEGTFGMHAPQCPLWAVRLPLFCPHLCIDKHVWCVWSHTCLYSKRCRLAERCT